MKGDRSSSVLVGSNASSYSYALNGKIMLASIIVVFSLVIIIVCFHSYARRIRRRQLHRQRQRHLLFNSDATAATTTTTTESNTSKGLDSFVLKSLPTFNYSCNTHNPPLECAVCLSEFEENEMGRLLPKCKHCFHVQCIDMWFQSHSSCPLCRSPVQPIVVSSVSVTETVLSIDDHAEATSDRNSGMYQSCRMSCSASSPALASLQMEERERKPLQHQHVGISIEECPSMYERLKVLEEEMGSGYSRGHHGLKKSPGGGGILSLKRIWSV